MPNLRKTRAELELTGAMKHDKKRYADRLNNPEPELPLGGPPDHWTNPEFAEDLKESVKLEIKKECDRKVVIWRKLVSIIPPGVLGNSDEIVVELAATLIYRMRFESWHKAGEQSMLLSTLSKLGLTPQDRLKMNVQKPDDEEKVHDPWDDLTLQ